MRIRFLIPLLVLFPLTTQADCLEYGKVTLSGTLMRETFAGPPNYESIAAGDRAETYWLLQLKAPVCVNNDPSDPQLISIAVPAIEKIQLIVPADYYEHHRDSINAPITLTGIMVGAMTGHHHTAVLLDITDGK